MKHLKFLFLAVLAIAFIACDKDKDPKKEDKTLDVTEGTYVGVVSIDQNDGTFYTQDSIKVEVLKTDDNTITLTMRKVKFAERMPMTLDMTIAGVITESTASEILMSGENIIPTAMGGKFPEYTITALDGKLTSESISFSMMCGVYPLTYSGVSQK